MTEPTFFEIPIYRCTLNEHTAYMQIEESKIKEAVPSTLYPESAQAILNNFHASIWYPWKYNEIIGYLNLYIMGSQFRADLWLAKKLRYNRGITKKTFKYYGKALEKQMPRNKSSEEIFEFMLEELKKLNERDFRKHYFDLKTFKVIGKFINWIELIDKLNSYKYPEFRRSYFADDE